MKISDMTDAELIARRRKQCEDMTSGIPLHFGYQDVRELCDRLERANGRIAELRRQIDDLGKALATERFERQEEQIFGQS